MNILSLDLSTKSSGWAYFKEGVLINHGCITSASTDLIKRIHIMTDNIRNILKDNTEITKLIIEEVRPEGGYGVGNQKTHKALMYLQAAIEFLIHDEFPKAEIEYIYPSSWRSILGIKNGRGIKRTSLKEADIIFVKDKYNIDVNDDEADAICIGLAQYSTNKEEGFNWE